MKIKNGQTRFENMVIDADRNLLLAAKSVQEDFVLVTNKKNGESKEFPNITTFSGRGRKSVGGWLEEVNSFLGLEFERNDFLIKPMSRLKKDIENHLGAAEARFSYFIKSIKELPYSNDYVLCFGGDNNFRYDVATIKPYKADRPDKPIVFEQLRRSVFSSYKNKIKIAENMEADDLLSIFGAESQEHFKKTGRYKSLLIYQDKDIRQIWNPMLPLDKLSSDIHYIEPLEASQNYCIQLLMGDSVDNIPGVGGITDEIVETYQLRKAKGIGEKAAKAIIRGTTSVKEGLECVVNCYKSVHGENWKSVFCENARLLWMLRTQNVEWNPFNELLDKFGVEY